MALGWAAADLLTRFNTLAARPSTDGISSITKYAFLAEAQREVFNDLALYVPEPFFEAPVALTAAGDRKTFTFPSSINPIGPVEVYPSLEAIPDSPLIEGEDYMSEGDQIRIPNNRSYSGTIYVRYVAPPSDIDASTEPTLVPAQARELIVYKAVALWAEGGGLRPDLADRMETRYQQKLAKWLLFFHNQYDGKGTGDAGRVVDPNDWYSTSPDLGV
jgi:hypothetical protein